MSVLSFPDLLLLLLAAKALNMVLDLGKLFHGVALEKECLGASAEGTLNDLDDLLEVVGLRTVGALQAGNELGLLGSNFRLGRSEGSVHSHRNQEV